MITLNDHYFMVITNLENKNIVFWYYRQLNAITSKKRTKFDIILNFKTIDSHNLTDRVKQIL